MSAAGAPIVSVAAADDSGFYVATASMLIFVGVETILRSVNGGKASIDAFEQVTIPTALPHSFLLANERYVCLIDVGGVAFRCVENGPTSGVWRRFSWRRESSLQPPIGLRL